MYYVNVTVIHSFTQSKVAKAWRGVDQGTMCTPQKGGWFPSIHWSWEYLGNHHPSIHTRPTPMHNNFQWTLPCLWSEVHRGEIIHSVPSSFCPFTYAPKIHHRISSSHYCTQAPHFIMPRYLNFLLYNYSVTLLYPSTTLHNATLFVL